MALSVPLSRSTLRVGGGSAFFVRRHSRVMRFIAALLRVRIKPIQNRWVRGFILAAVIAVFIYGFSDLCATIAHGVYGRSLHPVAFWVATGFVLVMTVWFIYIVIDEWRFGPRQKRRQRDEHDA